jgi:Flp pilus assembly protein TadD
VNPLDIGDQRKVNAAEGWLMLGNVREAKAELERLSAEGHEHPDALRVKYELAAGEERWADAYALAACLVESQPGEPTAWVWRAYAARRMPGGGLEKAQEALQPAAVRFPKEWIFPFNLACYACQMGRLSEARTQVLKALTLGGKAVRNMALKDPDLEPLRKEIERSS